MAKQLQLRKGTTTEHHTFTGAVGELTYDTTRKQLRVHDGSTVGGLPTTDDYLAFMPIPYPKSTPPVGYLALMGQSISQATYPILYSLYGATLPDLRGQFLRGLDYGKGIDVGRGVLSLQDDTFKAHSHSYVSGVVGYNVNGGNQISSSTAPYNRVTEETGGTETRPKNIAFLYIVKAG